MNVREILNATPLFVVVGIGILLSMVMCVISLRKAKKQALKIGFTKEEINGIIKSSSIFSIVPSIAIVIGVVSLSAVLGVPWSWFRLSVVGSLVYELTAAGLVTSAAGYDSLSGFIESSDISLIPTVFMVMSISILAGIVLNFFFGKKYQSSLMNYRNKDEKWGPLALSYTTLALVAVLAPVQVFNGPVHALTLVSSSIFAYILVKIINKYSINWLSEFVLSLSLIFGMASSLAWEALIL